ALHHVRSGIWELELPLSTLSHEDLYRLLIEWPGGAGERLPAWGRRIVQDSNTHIFSAQVWEPPNPYKWNITDFSRNAEALLIYEAHIGMSQEEKKVGTYNEFREKILPHIARCGYNCIQLMAIQEHPYYASFGYQVSNFFAPCSRFGTPDELKALIDAAHEMGIAVFLDLVHSHAVKNEVEGLSRFDGTLYQYFHDGDRLDHPVWDSRLFNYGKTEVLHFLLSNVRYWIDEFKFDGLRFDGVTSMLYYDHGLGEPFSSYEKYFNGRVDMDALCYLALANKLAHQCGNITTIAEDVSCLPGLAVQREFGGVGFDYRLAMGIPDFWIHTLSSKSDDQWHVENMFHALTNRRSDEKTISYAESHDQALVGDKTIIFRLLDSAMYYKMRIDQQDYLIERGMSLHRLIRLITLTTASFGYLNFMGNEFGHPEWIDFPRPGNNWSYDHARRIWSLMTDPSLQYHRLLQFDNDMISFCRTNEIFKDPGPWKIYSHVDNQLLGFSRSDHLFFFNFNPTRSFSPFEMALEEDTYELVFETDAPKYGGAGRFERGKCIDTEQREVDFKVLHFLKFEFPPRTAVVFKAKHREKRYRNVIREERFKVPFLK
ncbi:MAG: 1,4-alpha-glucan-branching enzyme, partial [SAR324 cluster bacterium]|nr:1,4-alpha-glucan-branching enzyme [SAR324 cluster bacterium]